MDETLREQIALFRYGVISELIGRTLAPRDLSKEKRRSMARETSGFTLTSESKTIGASRAWPSRDLNATDSQSPSAAFPT